MDGRHQNHLTLSIKLTEINQKHQKELKLLKEHRLLYAIKMIYRIHIQKILFKKQFNLIICAQGER